MVTVEVGPVSSGAARRWVDAARGLLLRLDRIGVGFRVPGDASVRLAELIEEWTAAVATAEETGAAFRWSGSEDPATVRTLATYWLNLAELRPEDLEEVGMSWPTDEVRPFHLALAVGVADALARDRASAAFATRLRAALVGDG